MLNDSLAVVQDNLTRCNNNLKNGISELDDIIRQFQSDENIAELFATTGFGQSEQEAFLKIKNDLQKIYDGFDTFIPQVIRAVENQTQYNNTKADYETVKSMNAEGDYYA